LRLLIRAIVRRFRPRRTGANCGYGAVELAGTPDRCQEPIQLTFTHS
jgi:hypothetical protein